MNFQFFLLFTIIIFTSSEDDFPKDKDVLILTDTTFEKALQKYEFLMVFFYAPWCIRCNKFHPEYDKAATLLKNENIFLAKVDATVEKELDKKFEITGYPVIKLFIKGKPIEYKGERNHTDLIKWIRRKTNGPCVEEINTDEEIEKFKKNNDVVLIYYGRDKNIENEYIKVARKNDDFQFGIVKNEKLINKLGKKTSITLYKNFDEKERDLNIDNINIIKEGDIEFFINKYSSPKLMKLDTKSANFIFEKKFPGLFLYLPEKTKDYEKYENLMKKIADKINYKLKVIITDIKEGLAAKYAELLHIKENELPTVRIIDTSGEYLKKYKMEGELNEDNILKFVNDWENNKIKSYIKSAEEPKDNNGDVFIVVGKTFEKEVLQNDKDIMLLLYSPLCYNCKALLPKYEELAKLLKKDNPKLILAKIDAIENEVESIQTSGYPKIKFFPGNKKDKSPIDYNGDNTLYDIIQFINKYAMNKIIIKDHSEEL